MMAITTDDPADLSTGELSTARSTTQTCMNQREEVEIAAEGDRYEELSRFLMNEFCQFNSGSLIK